jgi:tripartite ATP-independent transporter DctM subunit
MYAEGAKDAYLAIPLYLFMGMVLERSGLGRDIYDAFHKWTGRLPGGLAISSVLACTLLAAMTGLGGTGVLVVGAIALPEMLRRGYEKRFALGFLPPAGALGPLIPPSIYMIILGGIAEVSIGDLFIGGLIPGLISSLLFSGYIYIRAWLNPSLAPRLAVTEAPTWSQRFAAVRKVIAPGVAVIVVLGSIYLGVATPTESGAMGAITVLIIAIAMRRIGWAELRDSIYRTLTMTCMVGWLLMTGVMFGQVLVSSGGVALLENWFLGLQMGPMGIMAIMLLITWVAGMFIEGPVKVIVLTPIFMPVIMNLGIDPLWFCMLYAITGITAYVTPPVGNNLFYLIGLIRQLEPHSEIVRAKNCTLYDIYIGVIPYCILEVVVVALVWVFPPLALWLTHG